MKKYYYNYLFEIVGEDSELDGEAFFVYAHSISEAKSIAKYNFIGEKLEFIGRYTDCEAECMGYDTY